MTASRLMLVFVGAICACSTSNYVEPVGSSRGALRGGDTSPAPGTALPQGAVGATVRRVSTTAVGENDGAAGGPDEGFVARRLLRVRIDAAAEIAKAGW